MAKSYKSAYDALSAVKEAGRDQGVNAEQVFTADVLNSLISVQIEDSGQGTIGRYATQFIVDWEKFNEIVEANQPADARTVKMAAEAIRLEAVKAEHQMLHQKIINDANRSYIKGLRRAAEVAEGLNRG